MNKTTSRAPCQPFIFPPLWGGRRGGGACYPREEPFPVASGFRGGVSRRVESAVRLESHAGYRPRRFRHSERDLSHPPAHFERPRSASVERGAVEVKIQSKSFVKVCHLGAKKRNSTCWLLNASPNVVSLSCAVTARSLATVPTRVQDRRNPPGECLRTLPSPPLHAPASLNHALI